MAKSKVMMFEADEKIGMRCTFISELYKIVSHTYATGNGLLLEIKKHNPDVVFINLTRFSHKFDLFICKA